ncbi:endonuclease/exonuclease/phosphatase family protein [Roseobacter ponti]|uniref:Endonuclease/exonuclease/phosphatase family protein n=1 Tax=Roseobacter ponti TaxID=1891787 RepID=A0A858SWC3_9RHOB|nr:endonuclease/exonuclease/phosphatase family protein [Roseobacter ponti]QJF52327.1 endonuclease/exonuclease/phosphatase family protein [Roseobacter ponti]
MTFLITALWLVGVAIVCVTVLSLVPSSRWWVRMWEFPRLHILLASVAMIFAGMALPENQRFAFMSLMVLTALYQGRKVFPFTPLAQADVAVCNADGRDTLTMLASNVLMENDNHAALTDLISHSDPDVLLLMETNEVWNTALSATLSRYPTVVRHVRDNHYGMIFATRLKTGAAETIFLSDDNTPTLLADLQAPGGGWFHFIGLHPRPPVPGNTTQERDEQIKRAATLTRHSDLPVAIMGDFNDVAWSWSAMRFKHHGQYLDPRIGQGILPSFDANHRILRFPIDQFYLTEGIDLVSFRRGPRIGSDHFPMLAVIAVSQNAGRRKSG